MARPLATASLLSAGVALTTVIPGGKADMKTWSEVILVNLALAAVGLRVWLDPWPALGGVPLLDLVHATDPLMYAISAAVYIATPGLAVLIGGYFVNLADLADMGTSAGQHLALRPAA